MLNLRTPKIDAMLLVILNVLRIDDYYRETGKGKALIETSAGKIPNNPYKGTWDLQIQKLAQVAARSFLELASSPPDMLDSVVSALVTEIRSTLKQIRASWFSGRNSRLAGTLEALVEVCEGLVLLDESKLEEKQASEEKMSAYLHPIDIQIKATNSLPLSLLVDGKSEFGGEKKGVTVAECGRYIQAHIVQHVSCSYEPARAYTPSFFVGAKIVGIDEILGRLLDAIESKPVPDTEAAAIEQQKNFFAFLTQTLRSPLQPVGYTAPCLTGNAKTLVGGLCSYLDAIAPRHLASKTLSIRSQLG